MRRITAGKDFQCEGSKGIVISVVVRDELGE
jgi:hypothetical protein